MLKDQVFEIIQIVKEFLHLIKWIISFYFSIVSSLFQYMIENEFNSFTNRVKHTTNQYDLDLSIDIEIYIIGNKTLNTISMQYPSYYLFK